MDELLRDFLVETNESLDVVDVELVRFEQEPNNAKILANIFRIVHTIKGTCGFIGLPRLEMLAHAAEGLMSKFRDGAPVTGEAVTLVLSTIDRIKDILIIIEKTEREPDGDDAELIALLNRMTQAASEAPRKAAADPDASRTVGTLVPQVLERPLRPGEVPLDELERAFRSAPGPAPAAAPKAEPKKVAAEADDDDRAEARVANKSIRVGVDTIEQLMTMVSELVLTRNQLLDIARRHDDSEYKVPLQRLSNVTAELQDGVMRTRMQPIGHAWQKLPRIVRDLTAELGKDIELEMHGADTELDRQVLDRIKDPLTHMVRNSADHGIEQRAARIAAGKPEKGTIRLTAYHEGGQIVIGIADDGRGLDTARIRDKALGLGLANEADLDRMSEAQVHKFIFHPGFSTAQTVTSVSGRGVGLDVVRNNIDQIGGTIDVHSVQGQGLSFTIKIPLTLAIISALIVESNGERFAIPQLSVVELVRVHGKSEHRIERIKDAAVLRLRNKLLPLVRLGSLLGLVPEHAIPERGFIVITHVGSQTFGIVVDAVFHTEEIVVKPMASKLRHIGMYSGNTILGDGSVILIIDPNGVSQSIGSVAATTVAAHADVETERRATVDDTVSLLVFRSGSPQPKAVPLSLVTRLEEIDCTKIELSNGRFMVQYRGHLMPLIHIGGNEAMKRDGSQPLLVFSDGDRSMGLAVDEIIDIVEDVLDIQVGSEREGVLGSAIVRGQATEIVDIGHFLPMAFADWFRRRDQRSASRERPLLLVDDSAFFRNMLAPVLKAAGYSVTAVPSARDALDLLRKGNRFEALVTDIDMPEMDGFELAEAVRGEPRFNELPIIALSASSSPEAIERGRRVGFHDYVAKFDRQSLIAALKEQTADMTQAA
ncbi:hybrid sensor histidine kinase/response regulator [Rhodoplanes sp. Z2-YC6860]|uniref:hybrid sensor histidine kinase/response regulator n=1 Tax=Rhodoplanes sp. Z2-YC6860 TaxID=674703 RepID=UPI00078D1FA9|nr:chemotaxis protein CheW [Rhodoplanes sp. Z2-YC6860]AMN44333.1 signal transduction histidine kinase CheA [Rhodoplanes sp. Z2-YC6860]